MILKSIYNSIHKMLNSKYFWPLYYDLLVTLLWAVWAPALWSLFSFPEKIGDSYGGFTALVTGLSLVGIALNLYYQRRDTETQVKMLSQQLDEAKASKDALAHQAVETERLSEITALQSKLTFFSQISDSDRDSSGASGPLEPPPQALTRLIIAIRTKCLVQCAQHTDRGVTPSNGILLLSWG